jgi:hypothetical protein
MGSCVHSDEPFGNSGIAESFICPRILYSMVLVIFVIKCSMFILHFYIKSSLATALNNVFPFMPCRYYLDLRLNIFFDI